MSPRMLVLVALGLLVVLPLVRAEDVDAVARREDERLLREAGVPPDVAGLPAFFRKRTLGEDDRRSIELLIVQLGSRRFPQRERASRRLEEWGPPALSYLSASRIHNDLEIARRSERAIETIQRGPGAALPCAAARQLARLAPKEAVVVLIDYLPFAEEDAIRDEVFAALAKLSKDRDALGPVVPVLRDAVAVKRAAAGFVLGRAVVGDRREDVRRLLKDADGLVRLRTAEGLIAGGDKEAVPALIDLLAGPPSDTSRQAEDILQRLAGDVGTIPVLESDRDAARREHRDRWAKWWSEHGKRIDVSRVDAEPAQRGWTVVSQMSTGKVYELDRSGKVRWSIEGLSGPIDAQVLPGDRVLVSEHHGSKVSERNLKGTVLWEKALDDRPVQAQRLPGGNTFICTYSALMEVKRDGTVVYAHKPEGTSGQIYAGCKLRNGRILCVTLEGRILELESATGKVVRSQASGLSGCYSIQLLPRGNWLVASYNEGKVHEIDPTGKVVWKHELPSAYHAERLPNGHTLVSSHGGSRVVEVDRAGKVLSEHDTAGNNVWRVHRR